jgi:AraC family transcriptional regulator of adaptative response/methylated-DNA-[protein]-cysteine methyltransferase
MTHIKALQEEIRFAIERVSLGHMLVAQSTRGMCAVLLADDPIELQQEVTSLFRHARLIEVPSQDLPAFKAMTAWLAEPNKPLTTELDLRGSEFQRQIWAALQTIPVGQTISYSELAKLIGKPRAYRAVASACAANKLALVIPCHRVIGAKGSLAGYRWGIARKQQLLIQEKSALSL